MTRTLDDPLAVEVPDGLDSCEHCRTVTWAGRPACSCAFGRLDRPVPPPQARPNPPRARQ